MTARHNRPLRATLVAALCAAAAVWGCETPTDESDDPEAYHCDDDSDCSRCDGTCNDDRVCELGGPPEGPGACQQWECDWEDRGWYEVDRPDGEGCEDGDACTVDDVCAAGVCAGSTLRVRRRRRLQRRRVLRPGDRLRRRDAGRLRRRRHLQRRGDLRPDDRRVRGRHAAGLRRRGRLRRRGDLRSRDGRLPRWHAGRLRQRRRLRRRGDLRPGDRRLPRWDAGRLRQRRRLRRRETCDRATGRCLLGTPLVCDDGRCVQRGGDVRR